MVKNDNIIQQQELADASARMSARYQELDGFMAHGIGVNYISCYVKDEKCLAYKELVNVKFYDGIEVCVVSVSDDTEL